MRKKKSGSKKPDDRIKLYSLAVLLCFFLVYMGCGGRSTMAESENGQEQKNLEGSIGQEELEAQIREYYDAVSERDTEKMEMLAGIESPEREERYRALWRAGLEAINVNDLIIYPCGKYRIVVVSYDLKIEGIETKAPGAEMLVAERTAGDCYLILFAEGMAQRLSEDDQEMLEQKQREIMENQDIIDLYEEITLGYIDAKEDPGLKEWEEQWIAGQNRIMKENGARQKEEGTSVMPYIVKWGDCLWNIAGDMLGDGTKWNAIYEKNKDVIGEDPDYIMPGMELQLP